MALKVSRILHAGYVLECDETQIVFDPIFENPFSQNCYAFPAVQFDYEQIRRLKPAAVFISHYHDDHCSFESLNYFDRTIPLYVFCIFDELFSLLKELGFQNVHRLELNRSVSIGSFLITPYRALDEDVDSIFQIEAGGVNVLNVVDSWIDPLTLEILVTKKPWDLVLWPFQTMREIAVIDPRRAEPAVRTLPEEWTEQLQALAPLNIVPSSCQFRHETWSWLNHAMFPITYAQFIKQVADLLPGSQVFRLEPSASIVLLNACVSNSAPLPWVMRSDSQNVDYSFSSENLPQLTSEIAKKFPALERDRFARVLQYCDTELPRRFATLELVNDIYFKKPRVWRLTLFDHLGQATHFTYKLDKRSLVLTLDSQGDIGWETQIPAVKLSAALEQGESLTSMYIRVNDRDFSPDIEREIKDADPLNDPLIRCLFTDAFGTYQIAQLRRIREN